MTEARAIDRLYSSECPRNLVNILNHGWLTDSRLYFIDMEVCMGNLEHYIKCDRDFGVYLNGNPRLFHFRVSNQEPLP